MGTEGGGAMSYVSIKTANLVEPGLNLKSVMPVTMVSISEIIKTVLFNVHPVASRAQQAMYVLSVRKASTTKTGQKSVSFLNALGTVNVLWGKIIANIVNLDIMTQQKTVLPYVQLTVFLAFREKNVQVAKMDSTSDIKLTV